MSDPWRERAGLAVLSAALALLLVAAGPTARAAGVPPPPRKLRTVVGCLLSQAPAAETLGDLGLKLGDVAATRYFSGHVPGIPESEGYYLLLYSPDKSLAWLLIAGGPSTHGRVWPYDGAFNFKREHGHLEVEEGFGGLATYKTFGDFARQMEANRPLIRVRLQPCSACCGPAPMG